MNWSQKNGRGPLICLALVVSSWIVGKRFPVIDGAAITILLRTGIGMVWSDKGQTAVGIHSISKVVLQFTVAPLGFGVNLGAVTKTGSQSPPVTMCTIDATLLLAWLLCRLFRVLDNTATLVGVGSSTCGGSAIAATAPIIDTDSDEVAQAILIIFFFNVLMAIFFPMLDRALGFDTIDSGSFGLFVGTTINDTSSVTTMALARDSMWQFGGRTLDKAVTVKLMRTLAIIPITLVLNLSCMRAAGNEVGSFNFRRVFPVFILYFILATLTTTVTLQAGLPASAFRPLKELSKFCVIMTMATIGLNSNLVKLMESGGRPLLLDVTCWGGITAVSLFLQKLMS